MVEAKFLELIAQEMALDVQQVTAAVHLLDGGAAAPFIAHYRKDATGNLNEAQVERIADRHNYYMGVAARRATILDALAKQGRLTDTLRDRVEACAVRTELEDLFLPHKPRRRTKATLAEDQGLGALADFLLKQLPGLQTVDEYANAFVKPENGVLSPEEALEGARYILAERFALDPDARQAVRRRMMADGKVTARPTKNAEGVKTKFEAYYEFSEPVARIPSHRMLAISRGVKEGLLRVDIALDDEAMFAELLQLYIQDHESIFEPHIRAALHEAYTRQIRPALENEVLEWLRRNADDDAIEVFRENARSLLLAPPAGAVTVVGIMPIANGCKVAVVDPEGRYVEHQTLVFAGEAGGPDTAAQAFHALLGKYAPHTVAIANTPGATEAARFVKGVLGQHRREAAAARARTPFAISVSAGPASNYAGSKLGRDEFADLEMSVREAIAIARRIQDPLAELVKVEPRSIGVGQYQHDVNQKQLRERLHQTVTSSVNRVGVDVNKAPVSLLRFVCGIQMGTAQNLVAARERLGGYTSRAQFQEVDGIGPKVYEQCAGFLRISNGANPLDATPVHPEAYPVVEAIAAAYNMPLSQLFGNAEVLERMDLAPFAAGPVGPLALEDIRNALLKPGKDVRESFRAPRLVEGVTSIDDLQDDMTIEGVVTNVTDFGAFVDIGVQQDGLVHLSELSRRFVRDPRELIKVGDVVRVKVIKVDKEVPRISLSIKAAQPPRPRRAPARRPAAAQTGAGESPAPRDERAPREQGHDGRPRRPREEGRPQRPRPERAEPSRGGEAAAAAEGAPRDSRFSKGKPRKRAPLPGGARPAKSGDSGERLNTLLADQLAALREKLGAP